MSKKSSKETDKKSDAEKQSENRGPSTMDWFLFENKIRNIIQESISPLFIRDEYNSESIGDINNTILTVQKQVDNLEANEADVMGQLKRADILYTRVDDIERKLTRDIEDIKNKIEIIQQNHTTEVQKTTRMNKEINVVDEKVSKCFGGLNHSREVFLDLKRYIFDEVTTMKEDLYGKINTIEEDQRQIQIKIDSSNSQIDNHKNLLNSFDTMIEQINLDVSHKFDLTIKELQEDKLDK